MACRKGDLDLVDKYIASGVDLNQIDEWDYSPLILASLCGHEDVVRLLLEKGSKVDRDTFEGARAIYGALTDSIRTLLLSYDITKAVDVTQPFASHITAMLQMPKFTSFDLVIRVGDGIRVHQFMLMTMSGTFKKLFQNRCSYIFQPEDIANQIGKHKDSSWRFLIDYIYLLPSLDLSDVDVEDLVDLARSFEFHDLASFVSRISEQKTALDEARAKNEVQRQMCEIARGKVRRFVEEDIIGSSIVKDSTDGKDIHKLLTNIERRDLSADNGADIILGVELGGKCAFYPVHRAILSRTEYFETLFRSSFGDANIFHELEVEDLGVIDRSLLINSPENIPIVTLPINGAIDLSGDEGIELIRVLLNFLYFDSPDVPPELAIETLILADSLFIDRLKKMAAIAITQIEDYDEAGLSIYDILRVSWQTRMQRLETHIAKIISTDLPRYIHDPGFKQLVLESAERIQLREDYDTIELIADIKYYLKKKYNIDEDEGTLNPTMIQTEDNDDEFYLTQRQDYDKETKQLDELVESLGLTV